MAKPRFSRFDCSPGCSVEAAVGLIDGKWKSVILFHLTSGTLRFSELRRLLPDVTPRMLTNQLRELEQDGLVTRKVYAQVPPKVEYSLSPLGRTMELILLALKEWGQANIGLYGKPKVVEGGMDHGSPDRRRLVLSSEPDELAGGAELQA